MPSKNTKTFINNTLVQTLNTINQFSNEVIQDKDCQPSLKKQKVESTPDNKYHRLNKICRELSQQKILTIGLNQSQKRIKKLMSEDGETREDVLVFLIHDKDHEDVNSQLLAVCRQSRDSTADQGVNHYILPKFSKDELCKVFGVQKLTCFTLDFSSLKGIEKQKVQIIQELSLFNQKYSTNTPGLDKFRYADDSMFTTNPSHDLRWTLIKKQNVVKNPKRNVKKQRIQRAKSV